MASIREAAQYVLDVAKDGIGWIAFWKEGRGWRSEDFWPAYNEDTNSFKFDDEDEVKALREICEKDPRAIFVNSYVDNLGIFDYEGTRDDLAKALRWQYDLQDSLLSKAIA